MTGKHNEQVAGRVADTLVEGLPRIITRAMLHEADVEFTRDCKRSVDALIINKDHFKIIELLTENRLEARTDPPLLVPGPNDD